MPTAPPELAPTHAAHSAQQQIEIEIEIEIEIASVGNTMADDKTKRTVAAGSKVHVVLKNNGSLAVMTRQLGARGNGHRGGGGGGRAREGGDDRLCRSRRDPGHHIVMKGELTVMP